MMQLAKEEMNNPLVSLVMPVYNAEPYLDDALNSILNQTYFNIELIIVNDGSTDKSSAIIEKYKKSDKRIRVINFRQPHGFGGEVATNIGIKFSRGKYVAKMDSDDISVKNRIKKEVDFLEKHKDIFLIGSQAWVINNKGKVIGKRNNPCDYKSIAKNMFLKNCITHPSVMFRNEFAKSDFYKIEFGSHNDYNTWFSLLVNGKKLSNLPDYLIYYRVHGMNETYKDIKVKFRNNDLMREKYEKFLYVPIKFKIILGIQRFFVYILPESVTSKFSIFYHFINNFLIR